MIQFIREVGNFVGNLIGQILNIPIVNNLTFGITLIIIIIISIGIKFLKGGKGD